MTQAAIEIHGLGKCYKIGAEVHASHRTLSGSLSNLHRNLAKRLREGHTRTEEFWALRDVSLEIGEGEVLGLVGSNGAGKSTLLKILSRIVEPTEGRAVIRGRISSLLEVGTGFHTELTGRDNIFLNGAILGMRRREIASKFDEIVEFSEIEKFLDTPVKFYSSGMYVRLAFAVAAHLEPDVLIVDEVLAVGDQRFQQKSLGKMGSVARSGRTVIFVSHNTSSILDICTHGALLEGGHLVRTGPVDEVVAAYVQADTDPKSGVFERPDFDPDSHILARARFDAGDEQVKDIFGFGETLRIVLESLPVNDEEFGVEVRITNSLRQPIAYASSWVARAPRFKAGDTVELIIPSLPFVADTYHVDFICRIPQVKYVDRWWDAGSFIVQNVLPGGALENAKASDQLGAIVMSDARFSRL